MSLKVWLPLTGTLENKGVSNVTVTNNGAIVNTAGKIGSCYSFDGTDDFLTLNNFNPNGWSEISISAWVYPTATFDHLFLFRGGGAHRFKVNSSGVVFRDTNNTGTQRTIALGQTIPTNVWTHITCVYKCGEIWIYQNGIQTAHSNTYYNATSTLLNDLNEYRIARAQTSSSDGYYTGKINDFRIYDHCLSAAEVKEISQGLVLHYKLDSFQGGYGNPNLCKNSRTFGTGWSGSGAITQNAFNGFAVKYKDNTSGTSYTDIAAYNSVLTVNPNEVYTVSFWAKADTAHNITCFFYNNTSGVVQNANSIASTGASGTSSDGATTIALTTEWKYYWITWTFKNTGTAVAKHLLLGRNTKAQSGVSIAMVKLERGASATPWAPHPDDGEAITASISDSSGYGHNGSIEGNISLDNNTPRYLSATHFQPSSGIFNNINITFDTFTISFWAKHTAKGKMLMGSNASISSKNTSWYWYGDKSFKYASGEYYYTYNAGSEDALLGTWTHFVATYNGSVITVYRNGIKEGTKAASGSMLMSYVSVGNGYTATSYWAEGYVSDFRIYVTALSDDDVKQLYSTAAKVDNLGRLHTFEIKETNRNLLAGRLWSNGYSQHNPTAGLFTNFNSKGEYQFTANGTSAGSEYIPINPTGHTYEYDYTISVNTGNQFYIGFERYDANKTARSNNACVYTYATKPSSDVVKQHFTGVVNLSTDGTNPCAFIALRILNGWSGTTSGVTGTATIHSFSLREIGAKQQPKLKKTGIFIEEELKEETATKLHKNGIVETNNLIEL